MATTRPPPPQLGDYRDAQTGSARRRPGARRRPRASIAICDDEIRDSLEGAQLRLQRERGTDLTIFSPRASWMGHHIGNDQHLPFWTEHCNELVRRVCDLYPANFAPVCQLPQSPGGADRTVGPRAAPLRRGDGVHRLQPQPRPVRRPTGTARRWATAYWYPLYEAMVELDVPAMIHVSAACNPNFHTTGSHYLGADTTAFMQLITSDVLQRFPDPALHHPARRRRGAVPLGPVPWHGPGHGDAAARRTGARATSSSTPACTTSRASTCCSR